MTKTDLPPWSVPVAIHDIPESGRRFALAAEPHARAAVAEAIGVHALPALEATFEVTRHGRDGLRVVGQVAATVEQACVVTLEPVLSQVVEAVDLTFTRPPETPDADGAVHDAQKCVAADEAPEPLAGDRVDLGAIATEFLALGIDPYPRKSGAVFEAPAVADDGAHPFAALAALKKSQS